MFDERDESDGSDEIGESEESEAADERHDWRSPVALWGMNHGNRRLARVTGGLTAFSSLSVRFVTVGFGRDEPVSRGE